MASKDLTRFAVWEIFCQSTLGCSEYYGLLVGLGASKRVRGGGTHYYLPRVQYVVAFL